MKNWVSFLICAVLGLGLILCGLMVPAHLRAVDDTVLERAARDTPGYIGQALALAYARNLGAAQMLDRAAKQRQIPGRDALDKAVADLGQQGDAILRKHGVQDHGRAMELFQNSESSARPAGQFEPVTEFLVRTENRQRALELLGTSRNRAVEEVLSFRATTNTVLFPASASSSGQALDAALALSGLLVESKHLTGSFSNELARLAAEANSGGKSAVFEQALMDVLSLGQRFNWGQLSAFVASVESAETLRLLAHLLRTNEGNEAIVFAGVQVSANAAGVARYLTNFGKTGISDLGASLKFGFGGVNELLQRNQRLHVSRLQPLIPELALRARGLALTLKWIFYIAGGSLIAVALHFALPRPAAMERPLQVRGFYLARAVLFGLGSLLVVLLLSEPFLAQESQRVNFPFRLQLPGTGGSAAATPPITGTTFMNPEVLITMLIFFVLQALLYVACLVKLAEVRRQKVGPRMKLKLLENEEHLFDAGLYLGFLGTIVSLILVSLGVFKQPSLMAAYSATSFGILFVVLFKVVHLRPMRRKLLLEAESSDTNPAAAPNPFAATV